MTNSLSIIHCSGDGEVCGHTKFSLNENGDCVLENYINSVDNDLTMSGVIDINIVNELYEFLGTII